MVFDSGSWWIVVLIGGVLISGVGLLIARFVRTQDKHDIAINEIQRTYVTKEDFKNHTEGLNQRFKTIESDLNDLKEKTLSKQDYYRLQSRTEEKIDKIYDLLLKQRGN